MSAALIFFGCQKETIQAPGADQYDQETSTLKAAKEKVEFTGVCRPTLNPVIAEGETVSLPNGKTKQTGVIGKWEDLASDPLVSGISLWYGTYIWDGDPGVSNAHAWGKAELLVDDPENEDPNGPSIGKWDMTYTGYITITPDGNMLAVCDVVGQGKEGVVKGMTAKWVLTFNLSETGYQYITSGYYK